MKQAYLIAMMGLVLAGVMPGLARAAGEITIDLASDHVNISTGFTGADVSVFGVKRGGGDVVIVLEGPRKESIVRRKDRILGAWVNRSWLNFENVLTYYDYAMNARETDAFMSRAERRKNDIGIAALIYDPKKKMKDKETLAEFQQALIRNKQAKNLYPANPQKVTFLSDGFFRADFHLPSNVPRGQYKARAILVRGGEVVSEVSKDMTVGQVGLSANVNKFAEKHSFAYGFLCVFFAVFVGWFSDVLVRRNS